MVRPRRDDRWHAVVTDANLRNAILATDLAWRVRDNASQIEMLLVPSSTFTMGCSPSIQSSCDNDELPVHQVTLTNAFYLGRFEVTQAQWTATMGSNPSFFQGPSYRGAPNRPVEQVSWTMAQEFVSVTGLRLPTEAEWECACRAGTTTAFHSGPGFPSGTDDNALAANIAWYWTGNCGGGAQCQSHVVGGKAANALGLYDMSGNVWEWVSDWYALTYYASSPAVNPTGPVVGTQRVMRGGSWNFFTNNVRSSNRHAVAPAAASYDFGFRIARTP